MRAIPRSQMSASDREYQDDLDGVVSDFRVICAGRNNQTVLHAIARLLCGFALDPHHFNGNFTRKQRIDKITSLLKAIIAEEAPGEGASNLRFGISKTSPRRRKPSSRALEETPIGCP